MAIRIFLSRKLGEVRWTQADLARRTGIRPSTINEMYHELCDRVNIEYLDRICNVLNCDLNELIVYEPPKDREEVIKNYRLSGLCQEKCVRFFKKLINQCFSNRGSTPSVGKNGGQIMCSYFSIRAFILSLVTSWFLTIAQF